MANQLGKEIDKYWEVDSYECTVQEDLLARSGGLRNIGVVI